MREVRRTFSMRDSIKASGNGLAKSFDGVGSTLQCIRGKFAQHRFQLGEELLDGVEVGTVCGKVDENGAAPLNRLVHPSDLVNGDIVHEYDVTAFESWCENLFDVGPERLAIQAPSSTKGAVTPFWRRAAINVVVFQFPCSTFSTRRSPRGARP